MNNNTTYRDSPLGKIPSDWEVKRIADFGKVFTGNTPSTDNHENYGCEYMFVSPSDLSSEKYIYKTEKRLSLKGFSISRKFPRGSVLFTCIGSTIGKSGIATEDSTSNQQINAIVVDEKYNNEFLYYELEFNSQKIKLLAGEQAVPIINKSQFEAVKLLCPPLPEQARIAEVLSTWDKAITNLQATINQKELRNKWLMQQLMTGKKRLKGFENTMWKARSLGECIKYTPREVIKPDSNFFALGIRSHGKGIFHKNDFDPEDIAMDVLYEVKENDLVVNITFAWEHAIAIASKGDDGGLVSHRFPTYTFRNQHAIPEFFKFFILQKRFKYELDLISPGGAGRNRVMSKKDFPKIEVIIPDVKEQTAIANVLQTASNEVQLLQKQLDKLREQKKGLMQVLLTGKKRLYIKNI